MTPVRLLKFCLSFIVHVSPLPCSLLYWSHLLSLQSILPLLVALGWLSFHTHLISLRVLRTGTTSCIPLGISICSWNVVSKFLWSEVKYFRMEFIFREQFSVLMWQYYHFDRWGNWGSKKLRGLVHSHNQDWPQTSECTHDSYHPHCFSPLHGMHV